MNKRTVILITICCLLAVATVTTRYIEQEIDIIRAKFVGEKRTEERTPRGIGATRTAPTRTPYNDNEPAAVQQYQIRPSGSGIGQSPPAAPAAAKPAKPVITTTSVVPGKKNAMAVAVPDTSRAAPVEEVKTALESEPAAGVNDDVPVSERAETAGVPDAAASNAEDKKAPVTEAQQGADSVSMIAGERSAAAAEEALEGDMKGMKEAAVGEESDESQGEEIRGEDEPLPEEENEEGDQLAAEDETPVASDEAGAEQEEEAADEE